MSVYHSKISTVLYYKNCDPTPNDVIKACKEIAPVISADWNEKRKIGYLIFKEESSAIKVMNSINKAEFTRIVPRRNGCYVSAVRFEENKKLYDDLSIELSASMEELDEISNKIKELEKLRETSKNKVEVLKWKQKEKKDLINCFVVVAVIAVENSYEVRNGLSGMKRDIVLRLCKIVGEQDGHAKGVRVVIGMCAEHVMWRNNTHFLIIKKEFYDKLIMPQPSTYPYTTRSTAAIALNDGKVVKDSCIRSVLKTISTDAGITHRSVRLMILLVNDLFDRVVSGAAHLAQYSRNHTLTLRMIEASVLNIYPNDIGRIAISQMSKYLQRYTASSPSGSVPASGSAADTASASVPASASVVTSASANSRSDSDRAGLVFPVGRMHRLLKAVFDGCVDIGAALYLTTALEYPAEEILEIANNVRVQKGGRRDIDCMDIYHAIVNDSEFDQLFSERRIDEEEEWVKEGEKEEDMGDDNMDNYF